MEQILPWRSGPVPHLPITRMEALETAGQRAAARSEETRHRRNRSPARASASSGYGVPGQEASAPAVDVGPFPTLAATAEAAGPSVERSAPGEGPADTTQATTLPATPGTGTAAPQPPSSVLEFMVARSEPGEARAPETAEPSLEAVQWSEGARTLLPLIQQLLSEGMPELYELLGRLDCLGAASSIRRVRDQGGYTGLHDTFHHPEGGGAAELAVGNWVLAFCGVLLEPTVATHWTGRNDDAAGSFMESWVVTLRQAEDPTSRNLLEEFVRLGELVHRLIKPLCQVKQVYDLLDWRKGRKYCLSLLDQLAGPLFAPEATGSSADPAGSEASSAVARSAPGKEEEVQGHWGIKDEGEPLEVLAKAARALGEVAAEAPEAVAVAVTPGTLEAEVGVEEPDWSGDESPDIPVAIAKVEEDVEMPEGAVGSEAPKRPKRVVLASWPS